MQIANIDALHAQNGHTIALQGQIQIGSFLSVFKRTNLIIKSSSSYRIVSYRTLDQSMLFFWKT